MSKFILGLFLFLGAQQSFAAEVLCAGKWHDTQYGNIFGAVRYGVTCNDGRKVQFFNKNGCYSESCKENFLDSINQQLSKESRLERIARQVSLQYEIYSSEPKKYSQEEPPYFIHRSVYQQSRFGKIVGIRESLFVQGNGLQASYSSESIQSPKDLSHLNAVAGQWSIRPTGKVSIDTYDKHHIVEVWLFRKK